MAQDNSKKPSNDFGRSQEVIKKEVKKNPNERLNDVLKSKPHFVQYLNGLSNENLKAICTHKEAAEHFYYSKVKGNVLDSEPVKEFETNFKRYIESVSLKAETNLQEHKLLVEISNEGIKLVETYFRLFKDFSKAQNDKKDIVKVTSLPQP